MISRVLCRPVFGGGRRSRRDSGLIVGVLTALVASVLVPVVAPAGAAAAPAAPIAAQAVEDPARIFQFNMCGAVPTNADCTSKGESGEGTSVPAIVSSVLDYRPDVVTLNEVCSNQFVSLLRQLETAGYAMEGRFGATLERVPTCGLTADGQTRGDYGNAVLSRLRITNGPEDDLTHTLPVAQDAEERGILCVDTALRGRSIKACATHLSPEGDIQGAQVAAIRTVVDPWVERDIPVIIGGDFNVTPLSDALDPLYNHNGGSGRFREVDETDHRFLGACQVDVAARCRSGESTAGLRKIDYIFVSEQFAKPSAEATTSPTSDHDPLRGTAVVAAGSPVRMFQFNLQGVVDAGPSKGRTDVGAVPAVVESIRDFHPDLVTLNEMCERQFNALNEGFDRVGWKMYGHFDWDNGDNQANCGNGRAGRGLFSREPVVAHPDVTDYMACASTRLRGRTVEACVLHLPANQADEDEGPWREAADALESYVDAGIPVIVAGDFNAGPEHPAMDYFYAHNGGRGRFREVDENDRSTCPAAQLGEEVCRDGEITHPLIIGGHKYDYIFVSDEFSSDVWGDATSSDVSDHVPLRGWASLLPGRGEGEQGPPGADAGPVVDAGPPVSGNEGAAINLLGSASDDAGAPSTSWSYSPVTGVDAGATCEFGAASNARTSITCTDDGVFRVTLTASDGVNPPVRDSTTVTVRNVAPEVTFNGPAPWSYFRIDKGVTLEASFTDPGSNDTHTCTVNWDDGRPAENYAATGGACNRTHRFAHAGMYSIELTVTDDDGGSDQAKTMVVVYDPNAGFTNADGSLISPVANYPPAPTAGELWFDLAARYYPAQNPDKPVGTGKTWLTNTDFRFDGGDANLQWLVVTPDGKTAAKGTGTLQGKPGRYGFVFYGYDGCDDGPTTNCRPGPNRFRVVVWDLATGPNPDTRLLYDNAGGVSYDLDVAEPQALRSGIVTIHPPT
jgi:endonuclease/exonuclease/phosphatase family metal-dependent hydrolase